MFSTIKMVGQHLDTKHVQKIKNNKTWDNFNCWAQHKAEVMLHILTLKIWDRLVIWTIEK